MVDQTTRQATDRAVDPERDALYEKLSAELSVVSWSALAPHAERDSLFWVDRSLSLVDVAVSVALDDARSVGAWHEAGLLLRAAPTPPQDFVAFEFLIVQPFVLAAPLELELSSPPETTRGEGDVED